MKAAHQKAAQLLADHQETLHRLAAYLLEKETITGAEFMQVLDQK